MFDTCHGLFCGVHPNPVSTTMCVSRESILVTTDLRGNLNWKITFSDLSCPSFHSLSSHGKSHRQRRRWQDRTGRGINTWKFLYFYLGTQLLSITIGVEAAATECRRNKQRNEKWTEILRLINLHLQIAESVPCASSSVFAGGILITVIDGPNRSRGAN